MNRLMTKISKRLTDFQFNIWNSINNKIITKIEEQLHNSINSNKRKILKYRWICCQTGSVKWLITIQSNFRKSQQAWTKTNYSNLLIRKQKAHPEITIKDLNLISHHSHRKIKEIHRIEVKEEPLLKRKRSKDKYSKLFFNHSKKD